MTLSEMSPLYAASADQLRQRIRELRSQQRLQADPATADALNNRIAALVPLLRQSRELAVLTERYYDRSYHKHDHYTL